MYIGFYIYIYIKPLPHYYVNFVVVIIYDVVVKSYLFILLFYRIVLYCKCYRYHIDYTVFLHFSI